MTVESAEIPAMPNGGELPGSDGDLTRCRDAEITADTIIPAGLGDKLDLDSTLGCLTRQADNGPG
jgi:hypothetical protein